MIDKLNSLLQIAIYDKPAEVCEIKRLIDKAATWQRITDKELAYINAIEKELLQL